MASKPTKSNGQQGVTGMRSSVSRVHPISNYVSMPNSPSGVRAIDPGSPVEPFDAPPVILSITTQCARTQELASDLAEEIDNLIKYLEPLLLYANEPQQAEQKAYVIQIGSPLASAMNRANDDLASNIERLRNLFGRIGL